MKKGVQISFAITLLIISIAATIIQNDLFESIIYAVIVPSFLLSIISFFSEVSQICKKNAQHFAEVHMEHSDLQYELLRLKKEQYEKELHTQDIQELNTLQELDKELKSCEKGMQESMVYVSIREFLCRCEKLLNIANIISYTSLFLSLVLSPYIAKCLSTINLNCITLWSLTLLYFGMELKPQICGKVFDYLIKIYKRRKIDKIQADTKKSN